MSSVAEREKDVLCDGNLKSLAAPFLALLKACAKRKDLRKGIQLHCDFLRRGLLDNNPYVGSAVVSMYAKCGALVKAEEVLRELPHHETVSWNAVIAGYVQQDQGEDALDCYDRMLCEGPPADMVTFICALKACGSTGAINRGKQIHDEILLQKLLGKNIVLDTALVDMYAKCDALTKAQQLLDELPARTVISWNALISGYVQWGQGNKALDSLNQMQHEGVSPDVVTFICILKACGDARAIEKGEKFYGEIAYQGLLWKSVVLGTVVVDMYVKWTMLVKAQQVLEELPIRNVVSWNVLIKGYVQHGQGKEALNCFEKMQNEGLSANSVTYLCILKACGNLGAADKGKQVHDEILHQGLLKDIILGNALLDMYVKCGALVKVQKLLNELPGCNVASWNAVIAGYAELGEGEEALSCFERMQRESICPDTITFISLLKACGSIGAADNSKQLHHEIFIQGMLEKDAVLGTALVDMYAKCGALTEAWWVLDELPARDIVSWNVLLAGYSQIGHINQVLSCFEQIQREGISPDAVTFTCIFNACGRSGFSDEGQMLMAKMRGIFGIIPDLEHQTCMVDLLGSTGHFDKALAVIKKMQFQEDLPIWSALLGGCLKWGNVKLGSWAFHCAVEVDNNGAETESSVANISAIAGLHDNGREIKILKS